VEFAGETHRGSVNLNWLWPFSHCQYRTLSADLWRRQTSSADFHPATRGCQPPKSLAPTRFVKGLSVFRQNETLICIDLTRRC
jgi:hypothetical protein